jgi:pyruvate kinase
VQKHVIQRSRAAGVPVILATQVLESMRVEPRPTRAEVSDAAKAVDEGADAIMLAGETAAGAYPVRAVETLDAVIRDAESARPEERPYTEREAGVSPHGRALCEAAVTLASTAGADAIVAITRSGHTVRLLASLRPAAQVFGATPDETVAGQSTLLWGITPVLTSMSQMSPALAPASQIEELEHLLIDRGLLRGGSIVVFVNVSDAIDRPDANFVNLQRIG